MISKVKHPGHSARNYEVEIARRLNVDLCSILKRMSKRRDSPVWLLEELDMCISKTNSVLDELRKHRDELPEYLESEMNTDDVITEVKDPKVKKPVRVYVKEDAKAINNGTPGWVDKMDHMPGNAFDVKDEKNSYFIVWVDVEHSDYWNFAKEACVVVESE